MRICTRLQGHCKRARKGSKGAVVQGAMLPMARLEVGLCRAVRGLDWDVKGL